MFKIGIFAIIFNDQKQVLLLYRRDHFDIWELPGGGLQEGEAPWQGVIRETQEETGLNVNVKQLTGIYFKPLKDVPTLKIQAAPSSVEKYRKALRYENRNF